MHKFLPPLFSTNRSRLFLCPLTGGRFCPTFFPNRSSPPSLVEGPFPTGVGQHVRFLFSGMRWDFPSVAPAFIGFFSPTVVFLFPRQMSDRGVRYFFSGPVKTPPFWGPCHTHNLVLPVRTLILVSPLILVMPSDLPMPLITLLEKFQPRPPPVGSHPPGFPRFRFCFSLALVFLRRSICVHCFSPSRSPFPQFPPPEVHVVTLLWFFKLFRGRV